MKKWMLACVLALTPMSYTFAAPVGLADYAKHEQFIDIKISPDGKYIAATGRNEEGLVALTVLDRVNLKVIAQQLFKGKESVGNFYWANKERLLLTVVREVGSMEQPVPTGELYAMNADGSKRLMLTGPRAKHAEPITARIIDWLPEDPNIIMIASQNFTDKSPYMLISRLNINTGVRRVVGKVPIRLERGVNVGVILDQNKVARVAYGNDPDNSSQIVMKYRESEKAEWRTIAVHDEDQGFFSPFAFHADNKHLVGLSNAATDTRALVMMDPATLQETILASHPKVDLTPIFSLKNGNAHEIIGAGYEYNGIEAAFLGDVQDVAGSQVVESLVNSFPGKSVNINSATFDNQLMVVSVGSANHPTEYYLFDAKARKLSYLLHSKPWLKDKTIPQTEIIRYKSRDGLDIHALLTLPTATPAKNLPLILLPHGGPHGVQDSLQTMDSEAKVFAEHGYAVLQPNFRGSGGFGKKFQSLGYQNWGTTMIDDMTDGVLHLINKGIVNQQRVCVYGASYGGYAALMSPIRQPELYQCAVGYVGVYDLELMFTEGDVPQTAAGLSAVKKFLGSDKEKMLQQSPLHQIDKLKAPVFIVHGEADERVPLLHATKLRQALEKRQHPYQWLTKENEGHGFYNPENRVELWTKALAFFNQHIGAQ